MKPISFKDELPKDRQNVLVIAVDIVAAGEFCEKLYPHARWLFGCWLDGHEWEWDFDINSATHWLPMPTAKELMGSD